MIHLDAAALLPCLAYAVAQRLTALLCRALRPLRRGGSRGRHSCSTAHTRVSERQVARLDPAPRSESAEIITRAVVVPASHHLAARDAAEQGEEGDALERALERRSVAAPRPLPASLPSKRNERSARRESGRVEGLRRDVARKRGAHAERGRLRRVGVHAVADRVDARGSVRCRNLQPRA